MRTRSVTPPAMLSQRQDRTLLPGTGVLLTGAASLFMWGVIAGIAAIV